MNVSLMIKGADFSNNNVGKLNIQKLNIIKAGEGFIRSDSSGNLEVVSTTSSGDAWRPEYEIAYSEEINLPEGVKYLFGKFSTIASIAQTSIYDRFDSTNGYYQFKPVPQPWVYYDESLTWNNIDYIRSAEFNKCKIIAMKSGLYVDNNYVAIQLQGGIYGIPLTHQISKIRINWLKSDSKQAPEIGLSVPEIYVGF